MPQGYCLLSEAWSDPLMKQNNEGTFIINNRENMRNNEFQDDDSDLFLNNQKDIRYKFKKYRNPNINYNNKNNNNSNNNLETFANYNNQDYNNYQEDNSNQINNDQINKKQKNNEEVEELRSYIKKLESEVQELKNNNNNNNNNNNIINSFFGNVNPNEMLIYISSGIFMIIVLDMFTKLGQRKK